MHPAYISIARVSENNIIMHLGLWTMLVSYNTRLASTMDKTKGIMVEEDGDHHYVSPKVTPTSRTQHYHYKTPLFPHSYIGSVEESKN
jgi:hypothetical protein